jgi:hypothetical protein
VHFRVRIEAVARKRVTQKYQEGDDWSPFLTNEAGIGGLKLEVRSNGISDPSLTPKPKFPRLEGQNETESSGCRASARRPLSSLNSVVGCTRRVRRVL